MIQIIAPFKLFTQTLFFFKVGVVSEEKLLDLLEIAMSSDTAETVKRSRELMDSGVDPMALMSQLAGLIMDIIAGTYRLADPTCGGDGIGGRNSESSLIFGCNLYELSFMHMLY